MHVTQITNLNPKFLEVTKSGYHATAGGVNNPSGNAESKSLAPCQLHACKREVCPHTKKISY